MGTNSAQDATPSPAASQAATGETATGTTRSNTTYFPPLTALSYPYSKLPERVYENTTGTVQTGYNQCNATTEGTKSKCQTLTFNGPDDFCLWGASEPGSANMSQSMVSYCTKPGRGGRLIPSGAITGLQWLNTSSYMEVIGYMNTSVLGISPGMGIQLDPWGTGGAGAPVGGLVYSNGSWSSDDGIQMPISTGGGLPNANATSANNTSPKQVRSWLQWIGSGTFCMKICYHNNDRTTSSNIPVNGTSSPPASTNSSDSSFQDYCSPNFPSLGCNYQMPASPRNGTFEHCEADVQDPVGVFRTTTTSDSTVLTVTTSVASTYSGNISAVYTPTVPKSSKCTTFASLNIVATVSPSSAPDSSVVASRKTGLLAGGAVGGIVVLILLCSGFWFIYQRRTRLRRFTRIGSTNAVNQVMRQNPSRNTLTGRTADRRSRMALLDLGDEDLAAPVPGSDFLHPNQASIGRRSTKTGLDREGILPYGGRELELSVRTPLTRSEAESKLLNAGDGADRRSQSSHGESIPPPYMAEYSDPFADPASPALVVHNSDEHEDGEGEQERGPLSIATNDAEDSLRLPDIPVPSYSPVATTPSTYSLYSTSSSPFA